MIKLHITAFIAVFFMTAALIVKPLPTEQEQLREPQEYAAKALRFKEEQADLEVKRVADAYARMTDDERLRGDAEVLR